jgi:hypothetical protein
MQNVAELTAAYIFGIDIWTLFPDKSASVLSLSMLRSSLRIFFIEILGNPELYYN